MYQVKADTSFMKIRGDLIVPSKKAVTVIIRLAYLDQVYKAKAMCDTFMRLGHCKADNGVHSFNVESFTPHNENVPRNRTLTDAMKEIEEAG